MSIGDLAKSKPLGTPKMLTYQSFPAILASEILATTFIAKSGAVIGSAGAEPSFWSFKTNTLNEALIDA